ncbi:DoxX family protein [Microbulbifer variabilis]|uniref:DoxX family protein n=1 Tax=Microbulbifer variabilis TaxID=266805 RepID=A0ABY4VG39_9GAMM|nr:DoxX family protein [Microbulbifer variabilis]USD23284.1 DoxX family protein [Microbulbifer variabilis]
MFTQDSPLTKKILVGAHNWEWIPILVARVSLGLFFSVSGYNKLFVPERHADLINLMKEIGVPFHELMAIFLASVEFFGGLLLIAGLFSSIVAIILIIVMIVAITTVEIEHVIPKGIGPLDWLSWFIYLPQVLYIILFVWLITTGPGRFSLDYLIADKLGINDHN